MPKDSVEKHKVGEETSSQLACDIHSGNMGGKASSPHSIPSTVSGGETPDLPINP